MTSRQSFPEIIAQETPVSSNLVSYREREASQISEDVLFIWLKIAVVSA